MVAGMAAIIILKEGNNDPRCTYLDEQQLRAEMKKHQQMTDTLLGTMLEQREKMHAQMKAHREQMRSRMGETQQTEQKESEGHEAHHGEE